jgi:hypothetical protein
MLPQSVSGEGETGEGGVITADTPLLPTVLSIREIFHVSTNRSHSVYGVTLDVQKLKAPKHFADVSANIFHLTGCVKR